LLFEEIFLAISSNLYSLSRKNRDFSLSGTEYTLIRLQTNWSLKKLEIQRERVAACHITTSLQRIPQTSTYHSFILLYSYSYNELHTDAPSYHAQHANRWNVDSSTKQTHLLNQQVHLDDLLLSGQNRRISSLYRSIFLTIRHKVVGYVRTLRVGFSPSKKSL